MVKTIISAVVSIICTAAICITAVVCFNNYKASSAKVSDYLTEAEAADYIGLPEKELKIMRENLKYLEGAYVIYTYPENGKDVDVVMYSKDDLDKAVTKLASDSKKNHVNFKYIEQAIEKYSKEK